MPDVPPHVSDFIANHVDSVELIEVLLLLKQDPAREWTAEAVSSRLHTSPRSAAHRLDALRASSLAAVADHDNHPSFRYAPASGELDRAVRDLEGLYGARRTSIISLIFSRPSDKMRTFADAFRIREDK